MVRRLPTSKPSFLLSAGPEIHPGCLKSHAFRVIRRIRTARRALALRFAGGATRIGRTRAVPVCSTLKRFLRSGNCNLSALARTRIRSNVVPIHRRSTESGIRCRGGWDLPPASIVVPIRRGWKWSLVNPDVLRKRREKTLDMGLTNPYFSHLCLHTERR